jgi:glycosyltransferase involved in cell wall biosynthesis
MKVSILIPLYNSEKYIAETIECAFNQTWPDKEIIIVDDGSTDNSYQIAKSYESETLKVYRQENKGASSARNHAFSKSTGDLIQYLDADDMLSPNKIEEQVKIFMKNQDIESTIISNILYFNGNIVSGLEFPRSQIITTDYCPAAELLIDVFDYPLSTQTGMWLTPRKIIEKSGPWNEELSLNDDGEFFFRVVSNSSKVYYCATAITYYRLPVSGLSSQRDKRSSVSQINSMEVMKNAVLEYSRSKRARKACAKSYYRFYNQFDDEGYYNEIAEERINSLGFSLDTFLNPDNSRPHLFRLLQRIFDKYS